MPYISEYKGWLDRGMLKSIKEKKMSNLSLKFETIFKIKFNEIFKKNSKTIPSIFYLFRSNLLKFEG